MPPEPTADPRSKPALGPYRRRDDGRVAISLDNNAWDFLYELRERINLATEFSLAEFAIFIPRQIEIETLAIRDSQGKQDLTEFIHKAIDECHIRTTGFLGFALPEGQIQRSMGFGRGTFMDDGTRAFYHAIRERFLLGKPQRKSGLSVNEGDAAIGAASFNSVVLTGEDPKKSGPIRFAAEHGGKVLYLKHVDRANPSLRERVLAFEKL